MMQFFAAQKFQ
uniref:Uncharacterized protein n=1 Tax=Rhizophora mucronata TaxID=61149 RepID=A0A2P2PV35_RHIMU